MPGPLRLEVFESGAPAAIGGDLAAVQSEMSDEARLEAFESGYKAGWDDAVAADADEQTALRAEVGRSLQALAFSYHEARSHLLTAIGPLLSEIVARVLPPLARHALAPQIVALLADEAARLADTPVDLVVNPAARPAIEAYLEGRITLPLRIVEEPTLGTGQAWLRRGCSETHVDLDTVLARIGVLIEAFLTPSPPTLHEDQADV